MCACCGESRDEFLALDHIHGGGTKERRESRARGAGYWLWIKNNWPDGLRVLCHNCNASRGAFGYCPHENEIEQVVGL